METCYKCILDCPDINKVTWKTSTVFLFHKNISNFSAEGYWILLGSTM